MFYIIAGACLIVAMAVGFFVTLRVNKKLEKEERNSNVSSQSFNE